MTTVSEDLAAIQVRLRDRIDRRVLLTLAVSAAAHVAFIAWAQSAEAHRAPRVNLQHDQDHFAQAPVVRLPPPPAPLLTPGAPEAGRNTQLGPGAADRSTPRPASPGRPGAARPDSTRFLDLLGRRTLDGRGTLSPNDDRSTDYDRALAPGTRIERDGWDGNQTRGRDAANKIADRDDFFIDPPPDFRPPPEREKDEKPVKPPGGGWCEGRGCSPEPNPEPVNADDIVRTIKTRYLGGFKRCYEATIVKENPRARGRLSAEFEISALGRVSDMDFTLADELDSSAFESCLEAHARSFRFNPRREPVTVSFAFVFVPGS